MSENLKKCIYPLFKNDEVLQGSSGLQWALRSCGKYSSKLSSWQQIISCCNNMTLKYDP